MMSVGFSELILVLLVAFVIVGPKDLPKVARAIARFVKYLRQLYEEFKAETGLDETIDELKKSESELKGLLKQADPTTEVRKMERDVTKVMKETQKAVK